MKSPRPRSGPDAFVPHESVATPGEGDYLEVSGEARYPVDATGATLTLRLEAEALVAGPEALEQVASLSRLAGKVRSAGGTTISVTRFEGRSNNEVLPFISARMSPSLNKMAT